MKHLIESISATHREAPRVMPSIIELFVPFFQFLNPVQNIGRLTYKTETCKNCGTQFIEIEPYCPSCAEKGIYIHITEED